MHAALGVIYWSFACGNQKGMSVEKYHWFLIKTQEIAGQYIGTHEVFTHNAKTSQYTWNITPIDATGILRSVADFGREFRFQLEAELLQTPTTLNQGNASMYGYLQHVSNNSQFATSILQILVEEQWTGHGEWWNKNQSAPEFKVEYAVEAPAQVQ